MRNACFFIAPQFHNSPVELAWKVGKHGCESKIRDFYWNRSKIS